jgi:hypothetical protein
MHYTFLLMRASGAQLKSLAELDEKGALHHMTGIREGEPTTRAYPFVIGLLLTACGSSQDGMPSRQGEIFRHTAVGRSLPHDSILLGQTWQSAGKYGAREGDTLTVLPDNSSCCADLVAVRRDAAGIVTAIEFAYFASRDTRNLVASYRSTLGSPANVAIGAGRARTTWRDNLTEFVIVTFAADSDGVTARATLLDRARNPR